MSKKVIDDTADEENPELTEEDFARAKPFRDVFPEQYKNLETNGPA